MITAILHGDEKQRAVYETRLLLDRLGISPGWGRYDLAIAPLLNTKLTHDQLAYPVIGTLIMHPSLLPRYRGADAIKHALNSGDAFSGVTWFWASDKMDAGDICEQSVLEIVPGETPREFYERAIIPEGVRLLEIILADIAAGNVRRRAQRDAAATFVYKIKRAENAVLH